MVVPWDSRLGVHAQADNFTNHAVWDFAATPPDKYPLLLHAPYFDLYRKQVVKQADLVFALFACGDEFTPEEKVRDFEYYEALTVRDSSLSASAQAIVAAETGHLDLAYDYLGEAAFVDLHDLNDNTRDGLHMASLAGCWLALVCGFGGFRDHGGRMAFAPRLPEPIGRLRFRLRFRGRCLVVDVRAREATYALDSGDAIEVVHHGDAVAVPADDAVTRPIPPPPRRDRPRQPAGREPHRRAPDRPGPARKGE
jgi:alpha,alpha-trehalose phosphorylase